MSVTLLAALVATAVASFVLVPRVQTANGFFHGLSETGSPPGLTTLILSQVTTWIFARSLLNAAILGYFFGIVGTLAYAAYYLSFLTGARIVDRIRFRYGYGNVQGFIHDRFGRLGNGCYNAVVGLRLVSEVFANLLVVGIVFGVAGSTGYVASIVIVTAITLAYSVLGGLRASLRTDVLQMTILIAVLAGLLLQTVLADGFAAAAIVASSPDTSGPGWVLLAVAALQVWSYPLHDPVMMDRGFLADRDTTRRSFHHACWLSLLCIVSFGLLGVYAGLLRQDGEELMTTLTRLMGEPTMLLLQFALVLSAVSTLDSTLSSAAKLSVVDMRLAEETTANGRIGMVVFTLGGLILLFLGSKDLFSAVAISGTASMFLAPVVFFCILSDHRVPQWAFVAAFTASISGSVVYFLESAGHIDWIAPLTGFDHDYSKLLLISLAILAVGCGAFAIGARRRESGAAGLTSP